MQEILTSAVILISVLSFIFSRIDRKREVKQYTQLKEKIEKENKDIRVLSLKGLITNTELPIEQRLDAYTEYKALGGNLWVDIYYQKHIKPLMEPDPKNKKGRR